MNDEREALIRRLVGAAILHGEADSDSGYAVGDLEILFGAAMRLLSESQAARFFEDAGVKELLDLPEYGSCRGE